MYHLIVTLTVYSKIKGFVNLCSALTLLKESTRDLHQNPQMLGSQPVDSIPNHQSQVTPGPPGSTQPSLNPLFLWFGQHPSHPPHSASWISSCGLPIDVDVALCRALLRPSATAPISQVKFVHSSATERPDDSSASKMCPVTALRAKIFG